MASPDANHVGLALIRLSQELGVDALEKLNGWFSGLLVERRAPFEVEIDKLTSLELLHRVLLD